ncbi:MAG TPA: glyoxalase [Microscillaceae bacterium]|nr:glyoxalase [Microscillaceae bacterium]
MQNFIKGLHHLTATVNDAQEDYDFYTQLLGLRLVKTTVNFDNNQVYHFYYGNKLGEPSTIMTTFPYKGQGVRDGVKGTGQVMITSFSITKEAISFWKTRFTEHNLAFTEAEKFGNPVLLFEDPSGLELELVGNDHDDRAPWNEGHISGENAIKGLYAVTLSIKDVAPTYQFLTETFGFVEVATEGNVKRFRSLNGGEAGTLLDIRNDADGERGLNGLGTVHHVAFRIEKNEEQMQLREHLVNNLGLKVTKLKDRKYFQSIYFRIPGGVLFEVATIDPGFAVDEPVDHLGEELKLPEWEEVNRTEIEANLPTIARKTQTA